MYMVLFGFFAGRGPETYFLCALLNQVFKYYTNFVELSGTVWVQQLTMGQLRYTGCLLHWKPENVWNS